VLDVGWGPWMPAGDDVFAFSGVIGGPRPSCRPRWVMKGRTALVLSRPSSKSGTTHRPRPSDGTVDITDCFLLSTYSFELCVRISRPKLHLVWPLLNIWWREWRVAMVAKGSTCIPEDIPEHSLYHSLCTWFSPHRNHPAQEWSEWWPHEAGNYWVA